MADLNKATLERIFEQAQKLPIGDKATLINKLLTTSELSVVSSSSHLNKSVVSQISTMSGRELSEVIYAIAERIADFST